MWSYLLQYDRFRHRHRTQRGAARQGHGERAAGAAKKRIKDRANARNPDCISIGVFRVIDVVQYSVGENDIETTVWKLR